MTLRAASGSFQKFGSAERASSSPRRSFFTGTSKIPPEFRYSSFQFVQPLFEFIAFHRHLPLTKTEN
jgi:hypothetical protein